MLQGVTFYEPAVKVIQIVEFSVPPLVRYLLHETLKHFKQIQFSEVSLQTEHGVETTADEFNLIQSWRL
jgi:hypothetical protein